MRDFEGKVAVVTGGASGIGRAMAERFAREGMKVVLADVEQQALEATVTQFRQAEHDVLGVVTDVSRADALDTLARETVETYGGVHILCNNAGIAAAGNAQPLAPPIPIWEEPVSNWKWTLDVNLWGVIHGIRAFLPIMLAQDEPGHVVNTASTAGLTTGPRLAVYGVSKHGVVRISEAMFFQLRDLQAQVAVSVLCPGGVRTRIASAGRNRPDALLEGVSRLTTAETDERDQMWAGLIADGGQEPEEIADKVFAAIEEERFYILTHETQDEAVRMRMEAILERRDPEIPSPAF